eukprot:CAMPEP_0204321156 /NCGR_PEP_ID=MMETSP0469-20131031/8005_1 /ASSEMBLY_ACC=CAM_ASM_000384 /TAXON_ID=2969 /ORGANISM="Oxyrrhis marina" /LENGTH=550 /DNA_ID=CAMNT_0051302425 /DNA_START=57 /DNA_END=1709 /DNA_ORIENTATION=-
MATVASPAVPPEATAAIDKLSAESLKDILRKLSARADSASVVDSKAVALFAAHKDQIAKLEQEWAQAPVAREVVKTEIRKQDEEDLLDLRAHVGWIPVRLSPQGRQLLTLLQRALKVSEYTDKVDIWHQGSKVMRICTEIDTLCAILSGLVLAQNVADGTRAVVGKGLHENAAFFQGIFEVGRRYKILNPERMRDTYGKLLWMLMDSVQRGVQRELQTDLVAPVKTVGSWLRTSSRGSELLGDPLLAVATKEIELGLSREQTGVEQKRKSDALTELLGKYAAGDDAAFTPGDLSDIVESIRDHYSFQAGNRYPVEAMIGLLKKYFTAEKAVDGFSLAVQAGRGGAMFTHSHATQFTFVLQSLLLWREIMGNMFQLWHLTEADLLDPDSDYRLRDTGQGLNRVQSAPRVQKAMHQILHAVRSEVGSWVGLSVVHLGDYDVPNALVFIDKYLQVPRILDPIVRVIESIESVSQETPELNDYVQAFGGVENCRQLILQDFFKHGFDGSGDDGGSCIDGRLTSCWNWCSKVEKKVYHPIFLLCGWTGFDGKDGF